MSKEYLKLLKVKIIHPYFLNYNIKFITNIKKNCKIKIFRSYYMNG